MVTASAARLAPARQELALPIFEPIIEAIWAQQIAPKRVLSGPSAETGRDLADMPIDLESGDRVKASHAFIEHFRRQPDGKVNDTQYQLVSHRSSPNSEVRSVRADHPRMASRRSSPNRGTDTHNQGNYWGGNQGYGGLYLNWGGWGGASWR
jgi:hypothetical protein